MASTWGNSWGSSWGNSWGVSAPAEVSRGGWITILRDRNKEHETADERRARIFAEMVDDLETTEPKALKKVAQKLQTKVRTIRREARFADKQFDAFLASLQTLRTQRDMDSIQVQHRLALQAAYRLEAMMMRRLDDENAIAVILAAELS